MYRNPSLLPVCRQRINPSKTITGVLLFTVALLALSSCGQSSQGNAPKPTVTLATPPTSVGSPITPTTTSPVNSLQSLHMIDATTGWALTNTNWLYTTNGWDSWKDLQRHHADRVV